MAGDYFPRLKFIPCVGYLFIHSFIRWMCFFPFFFFVLNIFSCSYIRWWMPMRRNHIVRRMQIVLFSFFAFFFLISQEHWWNRYVSYACRMFSTAARFYTQILFWTFIFTTVLAVWRLWIVYRRWLFALDFSGSFFHFLANVFFFLLLVTVFGILCRRHATSLTKSACTQSGMVDHMPGNDPIYHYFNTLNVKRWLDENNKKSHAEKSVVAKSTDDSCFVLDVILRPIWMPLCTPRHSIFTLSTFLFIPFCLYLGSPLFACHRIGLVVSISSHKICIRYMYIQISRVY